VKKRYNYLLYKLKIQSDFPIAELSPQAEAFSVTDLEIHGEELKSEYPFCITNRLRLSAEHLFLAVKNIAYYEVFKGEKITIKYNPSASPEEISLFLLGTCIGVVLYHRGFLPLHASAIKIPERGVAFFTGDSGCGKSTTLNSFINRGYKMIADDVSAIITENEPLVFPSFPRSKLWEDSAEKLQIETAGLKQVHREMKKYLYHIAENNFHDQETEPVILYEINKYPGQETYLEEVTGLEKIRILHQNTYRVQYLERLQLTKKHFKQIAKLASCLIVKKVFRPEESNSVEELANLIEKDLEKIK